MKSMFEGSLLIWRVRDKCKTLEKFMKTSAESLFFNPDACVFWVQQKQLTNKGLAECLCSSVFHPNPSSFLLRSALNLLLLHPHGGPLQQDEYHMMHLVCTSHSPPASPLPGSSSTVNTPQSFVCNRVGGREIVVVWNHKRLAEECLC